jgi:hypothetical protein
MWQPLSGISSLTYSLVGIIFLQRRPVTGLILIGLGLSSALFHWTGISGWQSVDVVFIYLTLNTIIANFLHKGFKMPRSVLVPSVIVITVIMAYSEPSVNSVIVIGGQFAVLHFIIRHFRVREQYIWIFAAALLFNIPHITAFEVGDFWHDFTHTVWHSLTAFGFYKILKIETFLDEPSVKWKRTFISVNKTGPETVYSGFANTFRSMYQRGKRIVQILCVRVCSQKKTDPKGPP